MKSLYHNVINNLKSQPPFSNSSVYVSLLDYLFLCYSENKIPDEYEIAVSALKKGKDFDPQVDPIVRVYISKLRKKLETYYAGKGKKDKIRVDIPKRHYHLNFTDLNTNKKIKWNSLIITHSKTLIFIIMFILIIVLWLENLNLKKDATVARTMPANEFIWNDILLQDIPTTFVIGDLYIFREYYPLTDTYRIIRDFYINSDTDLKSFQKIFSLDPLHYDQPKWEIVPVSALKNFANLLPIFHTFNKKLNSNLSSGLSWDEIANNNLIYLGHYHNLSKLKNIFPSSHFFTPAKETNYNQNMKILDEYKEKKYEIDEDLTGNLTKNEQILMHEIRTIYVKGSSIDTSYSRILDRDTDKTKDYVTLAKIPGSKNNSYLFITSFTRIGRDKVIDALLNTDLTSLIYNKFIPPDESIPNYFEMLIEVEGFQHTPLKMEIKHFFKHADEFHVYE